MTRKIIYVSIIVASIPVILLLFSRIIDYSLNGSFYLKISHVKLGDSSDQIISKLGPPKGILFAGEQFINGYEKPHRKINNVAFVYYGGLDRIAYIYLNNKMIVEDKFIGGS